MKKKKIVQLFSLVTMAHVVSSATTKYIVLMISTARSGVGVEVNHLTMMVLVIANIMVINTPLNVKIKLKIKKIIKIAKNGLSHLMESVVIWGMLSLFVDLVMGAVSGDGVGVVSYIGRIVKIVILYWKKCLESVLLRR